MLYKEKDNGVKKCRIAARGDQLAPDPAVPTHASVPSDGDKMFALACMQADCAELADNLNIRDFDITGAFT